MNKNLFENLPSDITVNILSRLPVPTVACCKCVCKPWLHLVGTHEFAKSYLSKSVPNLLVLEHLEHSKLFRIFEFEDCLDLESHELHYNPVAKFSLTYDGKIHGSVDGLLFIRDEDLKPDGLFICNPITRDYIKLNSSPHEFAHVVAYGFGVSKISGEYKVVRISHDECDCEVYTVGTGFWRKIIAPPDHFYLNGHPYSMVTCNFGSFLNGVLLWLVYNANGRPHICCLDLETESFCRLSCPLVDEAALCVLGDSLCLCDTNTFGAEIVIWSMKECGDKKIWEKVLVICKTPEFFRLSRLMLLLYPLKVFKDGDVLLKLDGCRFLFYYSEKNKSLEVDVLHTRQEAIIHTPSFLSLKRFHMENVSTFWFCAA